MWSVKRFAATYGFPKGVSEATHLATTYVFINVVNAPRYVARVLNWVAGGYLLLERGGREAVNIQNIKQYLQEEISLRKRERDF